MNKVKSLLYAAPAVLLGVPALAENTVTVDLSSANDAADAIGTALSGLITGKVLTNVLLVVGASLAVWGVFLVVRWMKRGAK